MRQMLRALVCVAVLNAPSAFTGPVVAAEILVPGFDDLPVMGGLSPLAEGHVRFDSPGGRIVVTYLRGETTQAQVFAFYGETLEQLGWTRRSYGEYQREGEVLRLEMLTQRPHAVVRFTLAPAR